MATQPQNTGKQGHSQLKTYAFNFDCADPAVNFTNGLYQTDVTLKNKGFIFGVIIKYNQDLSAYPAGVVIKTLLSSGLIINNEVLPVVNVPNEYNFANANAQANIIAPNNSPVFIQLENITGSGITALSFTVLMIVCEIDS